MKKMFFVLLAVLFSHSVSGQTRPAQYVAPPPQNLPQTDPLGALFQQCIDQHQGDPNAYTFCNGQERAIVNVPIPPYYGQPVYNNYGYRQPYGGYRPYPYLGYGAYNSYYGYYDFCRNELPPNAQEPKCNMAEIKFKIFDKGFEKAIVRINGKNMGMIEQYSHWNTSGLRLRVQEGGVPMTLELNTKNGPITAEDIIDPSSSMYQFDGPQKYPVYKELFSDKGGAYGRKIQPERDKIGGREYIYGRDKQ